MSDLEWPKEDSATSLNPFPGELEAGKELFELTRPPVVTLETPYETVPAQVVWMTPYAVQSMERVYKARYWCYAGHFAIAMSANVDTLAVKLKTPEYVGESDSERKLRLAATFAQYALLKAESSEYAKIMYRKIAQGVHPEAATAWRDNGQISTISYAEVWNHQQALMGDVLPMATLAPWYAGGAFSAEQTGSVSSFEELISTVGDLPPDAIADISTVSDLYEIRAIPSFPWDRNTYMNVKPGTGKRSSGPGEGRARSMGFSIDWSDFDPRKPLKRIDREVRQGLRRPGNIPRDIVRGSKRAMAEAFGGIAKGAEWVDKVSGGGLVGDLAQAVYYYYVGSAISLVFPMAGGTLAAAGQFFPNVTTAVLRTGEALLLENELPEYDWLGLASADLTQLAVQITIAGAIVGSPIVAPTIATAQIAAWVGTALTAIGIAQSVIAAARYGNEEEEETITTTTPEVLLKRRLFQLGVCATIVGASVVLYNSE